MGNKLFGTDGVRGVANTYPMTAEFAYDLADILSSVVCIDKKKVLIGKDTRISGDMLEAALCAGFTANGIDVVLLGVVPTPLVTLMSSILDVDMSLMITASHNPYQDNGIKLITRTGNKFSDSFYADIEGLLDNKNKNKNNNINNKNNNEEKESPSPLGRIIHNHEIAKDYIKHMRDIAPNYNIFKTLRIVIDCANGAYSYIYPQTFKDLGAGVIAINNMPDGYNINKNCGSQHPENLIETVKNSHAHFGIAVDGDGDRIILVDNKGNIIDGDQLLCFLANYLKKQHKLNNNIVIGTEWSNLGLGQYLKEHDFTYFTSKVGERYVIDLMQEKASSLGGEPVGHIVLSDYAKSGDALVVGIIIALAYLDNEKPMSELFPIFTPYPCNIVNIRFSSNEKMRASVEFPDVKTALEKATQEIGEGVVIARKSGTEPVIKLRVEGKEQETVNRITESLKTLISSHVA